MAVYKVISDVEAEDKLLGPLSLKGLIYAGVALALLFVNFQLAVHTELGTFRFFIIFILAMPMALAGILAAPLGGIQPTEEWLLARLRFYFKSQLRMWDQSGAKELVTITVPKHEIVQYTKGFSQSEVNSRLQALATTLDSRGWAVKNVNVNLYSQPGYFTDDSSASDRLVSASNMPQDVPTIDVRAEDDILDAHSNPTAQHFDKLVQQKQAEHRQAVQQTVNPSTTTEPTSTTSNFWFLQQPTRPVINTDEPMAMFNATASDSPVLPHAAAEDATDKDLLEHIRKDKERSQKYGSTSHLKRIPTAAEAAKKRQESTALNTSKPKNQNTHASVTDTAQTDTLSKLAHNDLNNEITVDTLSKLANRQSEKSGDDEVVISLH